MSIRSLSCSSSVLICDLRGDRQLSLCVGLFEVSLLSVKAWKITNDFVSLPFGKWELYSSIFSRHVAPT